MLDVASTGTRVQAPPSAARSPVGIGLKPAHYDDLVDRRPDLGFVEVHAENYMAAGGPSHMHLERVRNHYPVSVHGVGLSLGGTDPLDHDHLARLAALVDRIDPFLVSEHVAWSVHDGVYYADLLPIAYTERTLDRMVERVDRVQTLLGRQILMENPSTYLVPAESEMDEVDFLNQLATRSGCGLLIDLTNVHVCAHNHQLDPFDSLDRLPWALVGEIHVAGCTPDPGTDGRILIDTHRGLPPEPVLAMLPEMAARAGNAPILFEWDSDVPDWAEMDVARRVVANAAREAMMVDHAVYA